MKNTLIIAAAALVVMSSCGSKKAADTVEQPTPRTDSILIKRLQDLQARGLIAFGHHDDPAYGYRWAYVPDSSDVKCVTGDYPAIFDWDLGMIEMQSPVNLDSVPFDFMREEIRKHHERGGINTISWHLRNPVTGGNSWDTSDKTVVEQVVTDGSAMNDTLRVWASRAADFIASLTDAEGQPIPVVFRPWHEHTGTWFWWGDGLRTPEQYKDLWRVTREEFDKKGLTNVVWAYSADKSNCGTYEQYAECYPGDEYIDILGADVYHFGGEQGNEIFSEWINSTLKFATEMAEKHGKVVALTETGSETIPVPDWYTRVLYENIKDYPIAYVVVWRNAMPQMKKDHYYVPYTGHPAAEDFVKFYNLPKTAFLKDLQNLQNEQ